jgi:hypothetical protein
MPVYSTMTKAAAPITGGSRLPPVDAETSIAPASSPEYPSRRIIGMVIDPVVTTSDTELPEIIPYSPDETTAILAGPPGLLPVIAAAMLKKNAPPPVRLSSVPNSTNMNA